MPALSARTDIGSSPPSPVDSGVRRLSWGKLVQRMADFSTSANSSSIESGSNDGSRSDLSDSGTERCECFLNSWKIPPLSFFLLSLLRC